jgi:hypothetical protein
MSIIENIYLFYSDMYMIAVPSTFFILQLLEVFLYWCYKKKKGKLSRKDKMSFIAFVIGSFIGQ